MRAKFGKYKAKEVDEYIARLKAQNEQDIAQLKQQIAALENERAQALAQAARFKEKEGVIAKVMIDATQHAKEIEEDYRKRAEQSDAACKKLNDEWISGMQSAQANLEKLKAEAKGVLQQIDSQFETLCTWADNRLESLEHAQLPTSTEASLEDEIAAGADTDLGAVCSEMGYSQGESAAHEEQPAQETAAENTAADINQASTEDDAKDSAVDAAAPSAEQADNKAPQENE